MNLKLITPEKVVMEEEIEQVTLPTSLGQITILPNHVNLVTEVVPGEMTIKTKGKESYLAITSGFLEVQNNEVSILADYAVRAEHIEVEKAIEAQKRAEAAMKKASETSSDRDFALAQSESIRALMEIKVAYRRRRRAV